MKICGVMFIFIGLVFLLLLAIFKRNKGANLIAGYNTMTDAEKSKYDEKALLRNASKLMLLLAALHILVGVICMLQSWTAFVVLLLGYLALLITGQFSIGRDRT